MKSKYLIASVLSFYGSLLSAQKVDDFFDAYVDENSAGYIQPLADLFTANLHTGTREWSSIDTSLYFRIGMVATVSFPNASQKTFFAKTDPDFTPLVPGDTKVPTIIGDINPVYVDGINGTAYVYPGGYNLESMPLATPQVTIGGIFHTEFSVRYFAFELKDDLGKVSMLGLGMRHSLNPYIPSLPVDLSVGYFYQQFKDDPYLTHNAHLMSLHIGKSASWWSVHFMAGYQKATTDITYDYFREGIKQTNRIQLDNQYDVALELSAALRFSIFNIHSSIQYSGPLTASAGLSLNF